MRNISIFWGHWFGNISIILGVCKGNGCFCLKRKKLLKVFILWHLHAEYNLNTSSIIMYILISGKFLLPLPCLLGATMSWFQPWPISHSCCLSKSQHHNHPLMHLFFTSSGRVWGQDQDFPSLCPQHPAQDLENSKHPESVYCVNERSCHLGSDIISGSSVTHNKVKGPSGPIMTPSSRHTFPGHNHVLLGSHIVCNLLLLCGLSIFLHSLLCHFFDLPNSVM